MGQTKPYKWVAGREHVLRAAGLYLLFKLSLLSSVRPLFFPLSRHLLMQTCRQRKVRWNAMFQDRKCFVMPTTHLAAAVKEEHELDLCLVVHDSFPALKVVLISRETVDEETELLLVFLHGVFHCLSARLSSWIMNIFGAQACLDLFLMLVFGVYLFEQTDCDFHGDNPPLFDVRGDKLSKLWAFSGSFFSQQISSRQMCIIIFLGHIKQNTLNISRIPY